MSDYSSDDALLSERGSEDDENNSETEVAEDPLKNYIHRNLYEVAEEEHQKQRFRKGMLFENVDKYREMLRDYVVQEGSAVVRLKNERTRVTCKCAIDRCL